MTRRVLLIFAVLIVVAAALGFYAWRLRSKVAQDERQVAQEQALLAPSGGPPSSVVLCVASDVDGSIHKSETTLSLPSERSERDRAILRVLLGTYLKPGSPHAIGPGADISNVFLLPDGGAVVDANAAFADSHPSGVLAEELTITSLIMTLNANDSGVQKVKILIDGKERETLAGHADLQRFYLASNLSQLAKDMP